MKQKDIATIVAVAGVATIIAVVLSNFLLAPPANRQKEVKVIESISSSFPTADTRFFNSQSVNSTQTVRIGGNNNTSPFTKTQTTNR